MAWCQICGGHYEQYTDARTRTLCYKCEDKLRATNIELINGGTFKDMKKQESKKKPQRKQHGKWEAGLKNIWPIKDRVAALERTVKVLARDVTFLLGKTQS